jgi:hypothetical protein
MTTKWKGPFVREVLPELASELKDALARQGQPDLAAQIDGLRIKSLCGCDDDFCGSFYTGEPPYGQWSDLGDHYSLPVETDWLIVLDVVDGTIRYVEVIDRSELRQELLEALPRRRSTPRLP